MVVKSIAVLCGAVLVTVAVCAEETSKPVTVRVVEAETGDPVEQFTYTYSIESPDQHEFSPRREDLRAVTEDGVIRIPAPKRCSLTVCVDTPWHYPPNCYEFKVLPDDRERSFTLKTVRGAIIRGVVLDVATGEPLAGAQVSPRYFGHPTPWINTERAVKTDEKGHFLLGGVDVDYGVCVKCEGYETSGSWSMFGRTVKLKTDDENVLRLKRKSPEEQTKDRKKLEKTKPRLFGHVVDDRGEPVGPYRVVAAAIPRSESGNRTYFFAKEAKGLPAGKPWELTLYSDAKRYWVMAEAEGFAPSSQVVCHKELDRPIRLRLRRGFSLFGRTEGPGVVEGEAVAMVQPMYLFDSHPPHVLHHRSPLHGILAKRVDVAADGRFTVEDLGEGTWLLQIVAPGATPVERLITVRNQDVRIEEPLKMECAGRVEGIVYDRDRKLMALESCRWTPMETIDLKVGAAIWGKYLFVGGLGTFTTDERGRFVLENVPAGQVCVGFSYQVLLNYVEHNEHLVHVVPGRTTEVRLNVPEDSELCWKLPVEVVVGDGSRDCVAAGCSINNPKFYDPPEYEDAEQLGVSLGFEPLPGQPASWPDEVFVEISLDGPAATVLTGISPGRYRMSCASQRLNYSQWRDEFAARMVELKPDMKEPLRIHLPAASVQVDWEHPEKNAKSWAVLLMALDARGRTVRRQFATYPSAHHYTPPYLRPCLDFVPAGRYTLLAWSDGLGWARSGPVDVEERKVADGGMLKFQPGGTIRGWVVFPEICGCPDRVAAVDADGISIDADTEWSHEGYNFSVKELWPGQWTIKAVDIRGKTLFERHVDLKGTEVVDVE